jgi:hypothetical protein
MTSRPFRKTPSGLDSHHAAASWLKRHHRKPSQMAAGIDTIAQCLNLEHEIHHTAAKLRILGFEPLN